MRTVVGWVVVLGISAMSCSGGDDLPDAASTVASSTEPARGPAERTATTTIAVPTSLAAPTTTTTIPPPPVVEAVAVDLREDLGSAGAVDLIPAQPGRRHLLIGYEQAERTPSQPRVWESPDGLTWGVAPAPTPPDDQTLLTVTDGVWLGETLAVGGSTAAAGVGPRAAVWFTVDGHNFGPQPELPIGDRMSGVSALAATDVGLVAAGWSEAEADTTFVAVRAADGTWTPAVVPDLPYFDVAGVAAIGSTIVVTGSDSAVEPTQARALVSTDGGASFQLADTSGLAGGVETRLGRVAVVPGGFVAVACAPTATGNITALARSIDGLAWSRQDIKIIGDDDAVDHLDLEGGGCSGLSVQGELVHIGVLDLAGWVLTVEPDGDAVATGIARRPTWPTKARWSYRPQEGSPSSASTPAGSHLRS